MKTLALPLRNTALAAAFAGGAFVVLKYVKPLVKSWPGYDDFYFKLFWPCVETIRDKILLSELFLIATGAILLLEVFVPAKPQQKAFSVGLAQDTVWLFLEAIFAIFIIGVYSGLLKAFYNQHLSFLTLTGIGSLPVPVQFTIGVLAADFMGWFHHWVRHKVPWFWQMHTIHHSQRELNMFTDLRYHFVEYLVSGSIKTFPLLMVGVHTYDAASFAIFHTWYTRFYHANIKSNFGPLRYFLVTPQSHRIHHSIEPRHRDQNFGVMFSIWDRMFGTQCPEDDVYPDTGIHDDRFPHEQSVKGLNLVWTPVRQLLFPFQSIARSLSKKQKS